MEDGCVLTQEYTSYATATLALLVRRIVSDQ
jgi:hypothetical protein